MYTSLDQSETATNSCSWSTRIPEHYPTYTAALAMSRPSAPRNWKLFFLGPRHECDSATPRTAPRGCCTPRLENDSCIDISNLCLLVHSLSSASNMYLWHVHDAGPHVPQRPQQHCIQRYPEILILEVYDVLLFLFPVDSFHPLHTSGYSRYI